MLFFDGDLNFWIEQLNQRGYVLVQPALGEDTLEESRFWEYIPAEDQWVPQADFPGSPRVLGLGFTIDDLGYFGLGGNLSGDTFLQDFWCFNPIEKTWKAVAEFPTQRVFPVAFQAAGKGFVLSGFSADEFTDSQVWEYTPSFDCW